jgi:outer membrane biosynthesis protein TonB
VRRPSPAIVGSILLHAGVVALAFVSWPEKTEAPKPLVNSVPVSIVSEETIAAAPADNPQPEPSPDDAATAPVSAPEEPTPPVPEPTPPRPTPTPPPPRPAPTPRPTPPRPQPTPPRPTPPTPPKTQPTPPRPTPPVPNRPAPKRDEPSLDLDALAGPTRNTNQRGRPATGQQGAGTASRATGPQLAALGGQVTPNWILNCEMPGMDALVIRVTVRLSSDGQVVGTPRVEQPRNDATGRAASDSMLRAIRATSPFNVPAGFTAQEVPFRFETARQCANR